MDVKPPFAYISQAGSDAGTQGSYPAVLQEQCNLQVIRRQGVTFGPVISVQKTVQPDQTHAL